MHAYLFVGGTDEIREKKMADAARKYGKVFEFPLQKIADVRDLADFTKFTQSNKTAILIKNINKATKETLNAFLKILEEPGKNISYFLSCNNEENLLSTITSRCQVKRVSQGIKQKKTDVVIDFMKLSFGGKIKVLERFKKREEAIDYLQDIIVGAHQKMIQGKSKNDQEAKIIKSAQKAIMNLKANANVNLQMTYFAVNSEKI